MAWLVGEGLKEKDWEIRAQRVWKRGIKRELIQGQ